MFPADTPIGDAHAGLLVDSDPGRPSRLLEDVLSRAEFGSTSEAAGGWLERLIDSLMAGWGQLPAWLDTVLMGLVIAGAVVLIVSLLKGGLGTSRGQRRGARTDEVDQAPLRQPASELYRDGLRAHDEGRLADAVVLLFRAIVHRLAEKGLLLDDRSRTNREYQSDLRRRRSEGRAFALAVPSFERVRYGQREATTDDADVVRDAARSVFEPGGRA